MWLTHNINSQITRSDKTIRHYMIYSLSLMTSHIIWILQDMVRCCTACIYQRKAFDDISNNFKPSVQRVKSNNLKDITQLCVYKLKNYTDWEALLEASSALADKKTLLDMYKLATDEPHLFCYINLVAKKSVWPVLYTIQQKTLI